MLTLRALEPALHALHDLLEIEPALRVEYRRVADLGIHDSVTRQILAALVGDTLEGLLGLHDRDRVRESPQVERERTRCGAGVEPPAELVHIRGRQAQVTQLARKVDYCRGP